MCDYELLLKTRFALNWTMFIQGHSAVSIRFSLPVYMYKSLLPQCCVNKVFYYPSTCSLQVLAATVLCQKGFLLPLYMYKSLLPQCCVNTGSYHPSTCTTPYCHSAVSIRFFTTPLHVQVLTATVLCQ